MAKQGIDRAAVTKTAQELTNKGKLDKAIIEWEKLLVETDGSAYSTSKVSLSIHGNLEVQDPR